MVVCLTRKIVEQTRVNFRKRFKITNKKVNTFKIFGTNFIR